MHIPPAGELAKTTSPQEVGRATGELCAAMAKVDLGDRVIPIPPYFKVFDVHHAINKDKFYQDAATNPAFQVGLLNRGWCGGVCVPCVHKCCA